LDPISVLFVDKIIKFIGKFLLKCMAGIKVIGKGVGREGGRWGGEGVANLA
jgi:hypothetical protein